MIRPIDIRLNAAHPELPLAEAVTFTGSPSTVLIRGVPPNCGRWAITAVFVAASFPDGSTTTRAAVQSANGVWVATLPATATSGRTANGLRILADGVDENGEVVTGYILGVADFAVASLAVAPAPAPGETSWQMLYFDATPATPRKGDVIRIDGVLKFYNGSAWEAFASSVTLDSSVTPTSANGVKSSGIWSAIWGALSALPTGFSSLYDWVVSKLSEYRDKLDLKVYGYGDPVVSFADGFSVSFGEGGAEQKYTAPSGGETITFIGPVPSSNEFTPNYKFYYPSSLGTLDSFDPNNYSVWCLVCLSGGDTPDVLMYKTGPSYSISGWNSAAPTLTLSDGEATGNAPTMTRPFGATGDTLAKMSQMNAALAGKANDADVVHRSGGTMTGDLMFDQYPHGVSFYDISATSKITSGWFGPDEGQTFDFYGGVDGKHIVRLFCTRPGRVALTAANPTAGNLAALDKQGNPTDSAIPAANVALKSNIPYTLGTPIVIDTASSEVVEGETVYYGAATLADRTANVVQVTAATPLDELRITFPAATSGKVRDFGLRVEVGTGSAALTAPALVPIAPTGETITMMNADGEMPTLADGTTTATGETVLYFTEVGTGAFLVKGEQIQEVA